MMVDKGAAGVNYVSAHRFSGKYLFQERGGNYQSIVPRQKHSIVVKQTVSTVANPTEKYVPQNAGIFILKLDRNMVHVFYLLNIHTQLCHVAACHAAAIAGKTTILDILMEQLISIRSFRKHSEQQLLNQ